jgi:CheY-like chemotaxis protein
MTSDPGTLRVVIVDDEAPARGLLREYLAAHAGVEVVGECANGFEAVKVIGEQAPDLVFLDIQMPKLDGFEVLDLLERPPAVVFVTAYDEYALKAFEVHAVDYVLKPVTRERLAESLAQARARHGAAVAVPAPSPATLAAAARPPGRYVERRWTGSRPRTTTSASALRARPTSSRNPWPRSPPGSTPHASCGSTAPTCSTSSGSRVSSCMRRTATWPCSGMARSSP